MKYVKYDLTIIAVHLNSQQYIFYNTTFRTLSSLTLEIFFASCSNFVARVTSLSGCSEIEINGLDSQEP